MTYVKNELQNKIYSLFTDGKKQSNGLTCSEVAELISKSSKDINQVLKNLTYSGKLSRDKIKRGVNQKIYEYNLPSIENDSEKPPKKTCNNCQRFSGLERCILLDLLKENAPGFLQGELKEKAKAVSLKNVQGCDYHDPRQKGQCKSKTMNDFIKSNTNKETFEFHCPIERCQKVIDELSLSLQKKNIGANTLYCPHCSSPINFIFNHALDRYQVQYWDSRFDILQRDYEQLTGMKLKSRYVENRQHGFSIVKEESFYLDLENEVIFVGNDLSPPVFRESDDLTYFSLKQLDYIAVKHPDDYEFLKSKLHDIDPATRKAIYPKIKLLYSYGPIESTEPTLKEIGGNEILIATGALFYQMFFSNILDRKAVLEKKINDMADADFKDDFKKALKLFERDIKKYSNPWDIAYKEWQQLEGGFGSVMHFPFKKEAERYGFENVSREKARMVRWEHFMLYGLFIARTPKASLENGVNKLTDNCIKKEIYNILSQPWDGLRGWCHRKYSFGLFLDYIEKVRAITPLWINEAIRNEEIKPSDFATQRGKRYEKYYFIDSSSEIFNLAKRISNQILQTKIVLTNGSVSTLKQITHNSIVQLKDLLNKLSDSTVDLFVENRKNNQIITIWKKLQETNSSVYLTIKEFQLLKKHVREFFRDGFSFESFLISEIL